MLSYMHMAPFSHALYPLIDRAYKASCVRFFCQLHLVHTHNVRHAMGLLSTLSLVALILALPSAAEPSLSPYHVHEKRAHLPLDWTLTRRLDTTSTIPLRFALKQRNIEYIGDFLHDVSHPKSPSYGKHWTAGEIARAFAPTDGAVDAVSNWLVASGIKEERIAPSRTRGWIRVDVTAEEAEKLMHTEYNIYMHASGKEHVGESRCRLLRTVTGGIDVWMTGSL